MPGVSDKQLVTMAGWPAGIDNLSRENALLRDDKGRSVIAARVAENVDIDASGKPRRRLGRQAIVNATGVHSLWRSGAFPLALVAMNGGLHAFTGTDITFAIVDALSSSLPISYALAGHAVYWSNGADRGVVRMDGTPAPWGCPSPGGQPALSPSSAGGLDAGRYQVAVTFQLASGEEGGASLASVVEVPDGGGITLSALPVPDEAAVAKVRVYVSPANGDVLFHAMDLAPGLPVAMIGKGRRGKPLDTQFLEVMPAGQIVRWFNGRVYVASGSAMAWSEALRYGLTKPSDNHLGFGGGDITLLEPVAAGSDAPGLYVAAGKRTYWLGGKDPALMTQVIVRPHGVVPGTGITVPASVFGLETQGDVAYWMDTNGVAVLGLPGGQIVPLREAQAAAPHARAGASLYREQNGLRQVVTALSETKPNGLVVKDTGVITVDRYDDTALPS